MENVALPSGLQRLTTVPITPGATLRNPYLAKARPVVKRLLVPKPPDEGRAAEAPKAEEARAAEAPKEKAVPKTSAWTPPWLAAPAAEAPKKKAAPVDKTYRMTYGEWVMRQPWAKAEADRLAAKERRRKEQAAEAAAPKKKRLKLQPKAAPAKRFCAEEEEEEEERSEEEVFRDVQTSQEAEAARLKAEEDAARLALFSRLARQGNEPASRVVSRLLKAEEDAAERERGRIIDDYLLEEN